MLVKISFDIECHRPLWVVARKYTEYARAVYRVCVDDDLITERDWIWEEKFYLNENIIVNIESNLVHTLKILPVTFIKNYTTYIIRNLTIEDTVFNTDKLEVSFKVNKYSIAEVL